MKLHSQVSYCRCFQRNCGVTSRIFRAHGTFAARDQARKNAELLEIVAGEKLQDVPYRRGATEKIIEETQKQASSSSSQSRLPQSPLTDPGLTAARRGRKAAKADPTPFLKLPQVRKDIYKNPYAQALASPLRQCTLTGAHVPKEFLLYFGLVTDPRTGKHWHMPRDFVGPTKGRKGNADSKAETSSQGGNEVEHYRGNQQAQYQTKSSLQILHSHRAVEIMTERFSRKSRKPIPNVWLNHNNINSNELVWREDMPEFLLKRMRERISQHMTYLRTTSPSLFERVATWDSLEKHNAVGAVLWFPSLQQIEAVERSNASRSPQGKSVTDKSTQPVPEDNLEEEEEAAEEGETEQDFESEELSQEYETSTEKPSPSTSDPTQLVGEDETTIPPAYAMAPWRSQRVVVYNMPLLFGRDISSQLQSVFEVEAEIGGLVSIRSKRRTADTLLSLWNHMGYLADGISIQWDCT